MLHGIILDQDTLLIVYSYLDLEDLLRVSKENLKLRNLSLKLHPPNIINLTRACEIGHVETVSWLITDRQQKPGSVHLETACIHRHFPIVKLLCDNGVKATSDCLHFAHGSADIIEFLAKIIAKVNIQPKVECLYYAAIHGHCTILQYLISGGLKLNQQFLRKACNCGHFSVVKYLIAENIKPTTEDFISAKLNGHDEIALYLQLHLTTND